MLEHTPYTVFTTQTLAITLRVVKAKYYFGSGRGTHVDIFVLFVNIGLQVRISEDLHNDLRVRLIKLDAKHVSRT